MEREYKWKANAQDFKDILSHLSLSEGEPMQMHATYYDTVDRLLRARKIGLRMRSENGSSICCLKLRDAASNGLHTREEYECVTDTLKDGLRLLPQQGAPDPLCRALSTTELNAVCETIFMRRTAIWADQMFTAELAYDVGSLVCGGHSAPLSEIECEQKSGDEAAFEAACEDLARRFQLKIESRSKLSRALDLESAGT